MLASAKLRDLQPALSERRHIRLNIGGATGAESEVSDGKIFIGPAAEAVRVRTGERGEVAV